MAWFLKKKTPAQDQDKEKEVEAQDKALLKRLAEQHFKPVGDDYNRDLERLIRSDRKFAIIAAKDPEILSLKYPEDFGIGAGSSRTDLSTVEDLIKFDYGGDSEVMKTIYDTRHPVKTEAPVVQKVENQTAAQVSDALRPAPRTVSEPAPAAQVNGATQKSVDKNVHAVTEAANAHLQNISQLADAFAKSPTEANRERLNKENRHLHGVIHVFSKYLTAEELADLFATQEKANVLIINAATALKREVSHYNINAISKSVNRPSEHLQIHLEASSSYDEFKGRVDPEISSLLQDEFLRHLYDIKELQRGKAAETVPDVPEAAQLGAELPSPSASNTGTATT